ncbi:hypothetical protein IAQ61_000737 [Plenodomus lingam]|uniref:uncharacterized protein n=1 Tax=Leptosphaeria maculans TaxID=5022 RepID=UPI00332A1E14|nr:hypothetical protein IAQ61_000737 [Plenodomus lingam]
MGFRPRAHQRPLPVPEGSDCLLQTRKRRLTGSPNARALSQSATPLTSSLSSRLSPMHVQGLGAIPATLSYLSKYCTAEIRCWRSLFGCLVALLSIVCAVPHLDCFATGGSSNGDPACGQLIACSTLSGPVLALFWPAPTLSGGQGSEQASGMAPGHGPSRYQTLATTTLPYPTLPYPTYYCTYVPLHIHTQTCCYAVIHGLSSVLGCWERAARYGVLNPLCLVALTLNPDADPGDDDGLCGVLLVVLLPNSMELCSIGTSTCLWLPFTTVTLVVVVAGAAAASRVPESGQPRFQSHRTPFFHAQDSSYLALCTGLRRDLHFSVLRLASCGAVLGLGQVPHFNY